MKFTCSCSWNMLSTTIALFFDCQCSEGFDTPRWISTGNRTSLKVWRFNMSATFDLALSAVSPHSNCIACISILHIQTLVSHFVVLNHYQGPRTGSERSPEREVVAPELHRAIYSTGSQSGTDVRCVLQSMRWLASKIQTIMLKRNHLSFRD